MTDNQNGQIGRAVIGALMKQFLAANCTGIAHL
jgi:hypothetical protein